jgi:hypothetical protein
MNTALRPRTSQELGSISVEEENLGAIPFAVLERRVGKRQGKLELRGTKTLLDGSQVEVLWQVQGNAELGLPTERDLDVFVALGVLTFQRNFSKTITFTGHEMAHLLNVKTVHGKFYQRLKLAMDRFIPLRFRALSSGDHHEEVKWLNVFQEASFTLDRKTGRCRGTVTWTDRIIQSMDAGLFRLLDGNRYRQLDGITAKHLYRYLATVFEKTEVLVVDARKLAQENLGIQQPPRYFSRLMQTLEPTFEQLKRIEVLGSYRVVSAANWELALLRHPSYVPESAALREEAQEGHAALRRQQAAKELTEAGFDPAWWRHLVDAAATSQEFYALHRAAGLMTGLLYEGVLPQVAQGLLKGAFDAPPAAPGPARDWLDHCEVALEVCREKRGSGQKLRNPAGFLVKLIKDPEARRRAIPAETEAAWRARFRQREENLRQEELHIQRANRILEYEQYCQELAARLWREMPEDQRQLRRRKTLETLRGQARLARLTPAELEREVEAKILAEMAQKEVPPFERWDLRQSVQQALLPFQSPISVS